MNLNTYFNPINLTAKKLKDIITAYWITLFLPLIGVVFIIIAAVVAHKAVESAYYADSLSEKSFAIFAGTAGIMIIIGILIVAGTGIVNFVILIIMLVRIFALKNLLAPYQFAQQNQMILYYLMHIIN
ncbi:hypothetical protein EHI52_01890 [Mesomycoplasma hyopneumoniae]|uniref:hypothetical protein n=1 Tax=Mesomycoplasma hyopneumoniae TaxID=2099 RepID=UPI0011B7C80E|nr:hypothetical protein [Mesomycoplasma hyopneumoniae]QEA02380.1 hypothetical protein EHI52_01890 [Mesomycoplasma hyopneumoniae]